MSIPSICVCAFCLLAVSMGELGTVVRTAQGGMLGSQLTTISDMKQLLKVSHAVLLSMFPVPDGQLMLLRVEDTIKTICRPCMLRFSDAFYNLSASCFRFNWTHLRGSSVRLCITILLRAFAAPALPCVFGYTAPTAAGRRQHFC